MSHSSTVLSVPAYHISLNAFRGRDTHPTCQEEIWLVRYRRLERPTVVLNEVEVDGSCASWAGFGGQERLGRQRPRLTILPETAWLLPPDVPGAY